MAEFLLTELKKKIKRRRTILSTVLAVLDDPHYQFDLENSVGVPLPSDGEMIAVLAEIVNADGTCPPSQRRSQPAAKVGPCCVLFMEYLTRLYLIFHINSKNIVFAAGSLLGIKILGLCSSL